LSERRDLKISVYIATSLDGFIARKNDELDWLPFPNENTADGDYGYGEFIKSVDYIVMGRRTFEKALTFGEWLYHEKRVVVLSSQSIVFSPKLSGSVECMAGSPGEIISGLAKRGGRHLYIDGGKTIQQFLDCGVVNRLIITRVPILLGQGIPLFGPLQRDIELKHMNTRAFSSGLVQSEYEILHR
jgi:dihydrofolate reductase